MVVGTRDWKRLTAGSWTPFMERAFLRVEQLKRQGRGLLPEVITLTHDEAQEYADAIVPFMPEDTYSERYMEFRRELAEGNGLLLGVKVRVRPLIATGVGGIGARLKG